ncbi:MAG: flavodoxin family protein [Candidatus Hermodarchaeota archaeon]
MKILITYFSQSGNTKMIAEAMKIGLSTEEVDLKPINEMDPTDFGKYDLVFLGSGVYASRVHNSVVNLMKEVTEFPIKFVYFCTHASLELYQTPFAKVTKILDKNNCIIIGKFDCVGENKVMSLENRMQAINNLSAKERNKALNNLKLTEGRPNEKDIENAKEFAQSILQKI